MADLTVRPSVKLLKAAYLLSALLAAMILLAAVARGTQDLAYMLVVPVLIAVWAAARHIARRFTRLVVEGGRVRYESGILSKRTRTMELRKLQDVRVDQSFGQRLINVGNLSLETAGETSLITITDVDRPREVADRILAAADRA
jgi:uncharacterized membrane protein YdbT with pleckstrin-like domain